MFHKETGSVRALNIIENFQSEVVKFIQVVPNEVQSKLIFAVESKDKIA
jgi:glutamate synthase domain-containing protein 3